MPTDSLRKPYRFMSVFDHGKARRGHEHRAISYLLILPALLLIIVLLLGPTLAMFTLSATTWEFGSRSLSFVGVANFVELFRDPGYWRSLRNTILYVGLTVPGTVLLGLIAALLVESRTSFRAFYRTASLLPFMGTMAAMALVWEAMLHPTVGFVNHLFRLFGSRGMNWLHDPRTALATIVVIGIWQNFGFVMVLFIAGIKTIPIDLYEAAQIDGADSVADRIRLVTLPLLGPTTMFVLVFMALRTLQVFDTVILLTQGGPIGSTQMLLPMMYQESFIFLRTGYGAAIATTYFCLAASLAFVQTLTLERRIHYK